MTAKQEKLTKEQRQYIIDTVAQIRKEKLDGLKEVKIPPSKLSDKIKIDQIKSWDAELLSDRRWDLNTPIGKCFKFVEETLSTKSLVEAIYKDARNITNITVLKGNAAEAYKLLKEFENEVYK